MKDLEKQIEAEAKKYVIANFLEATIWKQDTADAFISGAEYGLKIAKEYWQQGMYTEEKVINLIQEYYKFLNNKQDSRVFKQWLEENKKK